MNARGKKRELTKEEKADIMRKEAQVILSMLPFIYRRVHPWTHRRLS